MIHVDVLIGQKLAFTRRPTGLQRNDVRSGLLRSRGLIFHQPIVSAFDTEIEKLFVSQFVAITFGRQKHPELGQRMCSCVAMNSLHQILDRRIAQNTSKIFWNSPLARLGSLDILISATNSRFAIRPTTSSNDSLRVAVSAFVWSDLISARAPSTTFFNIPSGISSIVVFPLASVLPVAQSSLSCFD